MPLFGKKSRADANTDPILQTYKVLYRGGHPDYVKSKSGKIDMELRSDRFELKSTMGTKWFKGLSIPYAAVLDVRTVERQVGTAEAILGGLDSRQLNQKNTLEFDYDAEGKLIQLRLEMLSGVTVMGQAKKSLEFQDFLRNSGIRAQFRAPDATKSDSAEADVFEQLRQLAGLRDSGVLTSAEFDAKKSDLLRRM